MPKTVKHKPIDTTGIRIRVGDTVRVVGVPDLKGMGPKQRRESLPVFKYLVGKYKKIEEFDSYGCAWLTFIIRKGPVRKIIRKLLDITHKAELLYYSYAHVKCLLTCKDCGN